MPTAASLASMAAVLGRLASPADVQAAYLADLGVSGSIDELALEFDDLFKPLEPRLDGLRGWEAALASLRELDSSLSSEQLSWSYEALQSSQGWEEIRRLARASEQLVRAAAASAKDAAG
jgi:hypothetical protein